MIEQIVEFSGNHLLLVSAEVIAILLLLQNLLSGNKGNITAQQATVMMNHEDAVVLDVRPNADFAKGHIINAVNIPAQSVTKQLQQLDKYKNRPIIVSCRSGAQSAAICRQLGKEGFENVHNLKGGILAWQSENLPVTTK
ncbi:MAG: rhodanese-like domain-containing protein [Chromatiales bacterium]|jgi:rhodanese-related sulfurtransferase